MSLVLVVKKKKAKQVVSSPQAIKFLALALHYSSMGSQLITCQCFMAPHVLFT